MAAVGLEAVEVCVECGERAVEAGAFLCSVCAVSERQKFEAHHFTSRCGRPVAIHLDDSYLPQ